MLDINNKFLKTNNYIFFRLLIILISSYILIFIMISILNNYEFYGTDFDNWAHWMKTYFVYASSPVDLSVMNPVQGLCGLIQPIAVWLNPASLFPHIISPYIDYQISSFFISCFIYTISLIFLARTLNFSLIASLFISQLIVFMYIPRSSLLARIFNVNAAFLYSIAEGFITIISITIIIFSMYYRLGKSTFIKNAFYVIIINLLIIYVLILDPLYSAMFLVAPAIFTIGLIIYSDNKNILAWRITSTLITITLLLLFNVHKFYYALSAYMARAVFPNELYVEIQKMDDLTAYMMQSNISLIICSTIILISIFIINNDKKEMKGVAISIIFYLLSMSILSIVYVYSGIRWHLPLPVYLEYSAHPFYIIIMIYGLLLFYKKFKVKIDAMINNNRFYQKIDKLFLKPNRGNLLIYSFAIFMLLLIISSFFKPAYFRCKFGNQRTQYVYKSSKIVDFLKSELSIIPDGKFRGSVATIVGVPGSPIAHYLGFSDYAPYAKENIDKVPEYLRRTYDARLFMTGLWNLGIPTLEDNNHLITPPFHFLFSRALSRPIDYHSRNWTVITKANPSLMATLGCRFIITDDVINNDQLQLRMVDRNCDGLILYLYELINPNLADRSPTNITLIDDAPNTIKQINDSHFSLKDNVILNREINSNLIPVDSSVMYFEKGGIRVKATTRKTSLLLLPIQFSNSIKINESDTNQIGSVIKIVRANLVQTGIIFTGTINIKLSHNFGLFRNIRGREQDILDCKKLNIKETGEIPYPTNYQPKSLLSLR